MFNSKKIIFLSHQEKSELGIMKSFFLKNNYEIEIIKPLHGFELPEYINNYSGVIILGGVMNIEDTEVFPQLKNEITWIKNLMEINIPILGICLGAQLIASAAGAKVQKHKNNLVEVGYKSISFVNKDKAINFYPEKVFQWHTQGIELPNKSLLLAYNSIFNVQAFNLKNSIFGFQFHPEVNKEMIINWNNKPNNILSKNGAVEKTIQLKDHIKYSNYVGNWFEIFLNNWLISSR